MLLIHFLSSPSEIAVHGSVTIDGGREEAPPFRNMTGPASAARSSSPRQSLSSTLPKLAPPPWDPVRVSTTDTVALLLLPPALIFVHPAVYFPASIYVLFTPDRNSASFLATPLSLSSSRQQQRR